MNDIEMALNERFLLQQEYLGGDKEVNKLIPVVSVVVATYQHVGYIEDCLEGILMQKTDSPFEIIIGEDGSRDGTQEICKEYAKKYPDKIRLFIRDRKLSQFIDFEGNTIRFNGVWNRMSARGKYIAICEGDDYWIDPLKLQKQVDFLEKHEEYGMVYTKAQQYMNTLGVFAKNIGIETTLFEQILESNHIPALTVVLRKVIYQEYDIDIQPSTRNWKMGDYPLWLYISIHSKVHFINQVTAIYRVLDNSASHHQDGNKMLAFSRSVQDIREFFAVKFSPDLLEVTKESGIRYMFEMACIAGDKMMQKELRMQAKKYNSKKTLFLRIFGYTPRLYVKIVNLYRNF